MNNRLLIFYITEGESKMKKLLRFLKDEEGAVAVEYSLIAALVVVVIMAALINII